MPTFRLVIVLRNVRSDLWPSEDKTRTVLCNISGCANAEDAKAKAGRIYNSIEKFKSVEEAKIGKER